MITRYNFKWTKPVKKSTPIKVEFEYISLIDPISFNDDKSVKEYKLVERYVKHESYWKDFIKSFDLGSISEQVLNHITKGTPLVTAHTLPAGDYTPDSLKKGVEIVREMREKGITLDMISEALKSSVNEEVNQPKKEGGAE